MKAPDCKLEVIKQLTKSTPVFKDEIKLSFIGNVYTQSLESSLLFVLFGEDYAPS